MTEDPTHTTSLPDAGDVRRLRAVVYGAETELGRAVVQALRDRGATVGVTSSSTEGAALFALKRAAAGAPAQAVDLGNATNVRVATRKLVKQIGVPDLIVAIPPPTLPDDALDGLLDIAARELARSSSPQLVLIAAAGSPARGVRDLPAAIREVRLDQLPASTPVETASALIASLRPAD